MCLGLGSGIPPPGLDVLGRDEVVRSRVPGAFSGELEEERLSASPLDDGPLSVCSQEHPLGAAGFGGDRPAFGDERLECGREIGVVDGVESDGLESTRESGARLCAGHALELGQARQVYGYGQGEVDLRPTRESDRLFVGQGVAEGDEQL